MKRRPKYEYSWCFRNEQQVVSTEITQIYLELSSHCNLTCSACMRSSIIDFIPTHFTPGLMGKLLPMLRELPSLQRVVLLGFGECLMNPDFRDLARSLRELDCEIVLATNAMLLSTGVADFLLELPIDSMYTSWDDRIDRQVPVLRSGAALEVFNDNVAYLARRSKQAENRPVLGLEIVATSHNYPVIGDIASLGIDSGFDEILITNLYPYSNPTNGELLYTFFKKPKISLMKAVKKERKKIPIRIAAQHADCNRRCPFIERGTLFITASGNVSPCPELAYTHRAFYNGLVRMQRSYDLGNIGRDRLTDIWNDPEFKWFRWQFSDFNFPDCSFCPDPDRCWHRNHDEEDCYGNSTPCGECLWAKNIVICP